MKREMRIENKDLAVAEAHGGDCHISLRKFGITVAIVVVYLLAVTCVIQALHWFGPIAPTH